MQSTEIWMVEDDSPRVKLENTLDSKFSNFSNGQEQLLIARQYNIVDPAMLVSVSLLRHSDKQSNTQSGLAEFTLHPEFEQRTQEYQRDILKRFDGDPRLLEYTWVDGGVGEYGDWMCTFHIIDTTMADGVENTHLSLICPAGARTIKLIGIITRENRDTVLSEISKFVASMDVTETNWMVE